MTKKTILELAKLLDDYAGKVNERYHKKLGKITKFGDARERFRHKLGADGMMSLLSKTDQKKLISIMKQYRIAANQRDAELDEIQIKLKRILAGGATNDDG